MTRFAKIKSQSGPASEFEGKGPFKSGVFGLESAKEKARVMRSTEQDPEGVVDLNMKSRYREGGVHQHGDIIAGTIGLPGTPSHRPRLGRKQQDDE